MTEKLRELHYQMVVRSLRAKDEIVKLSSQSELDAAGLMHLTRQAATLGTCEYVLGMLVEEPTKTGDSNVEVAPN